jgi:AcrR family transcriptional regulator
MATPADDHVAGSTAAVRLKLVPDAIRYAERMAREQRRSTRSDTTLTPERIVQAALRISDTEGDLDGLTVRRLATDLGVGAMTLYSYFRSKDEILDAVADHVLGGMALPAAPDATPADALRAVGYGFFTMMREHPSVVRILANRVTDSRTALRGAMEGCLRRLVDGGIPASAAAHCYGFLITYAMGFATYQRPRPWGTRAGAAGTEERRQRMHFYAGLPRQDLPLIVDLAGDLVGMASDEQFAWGLEAFIDSVVRSLAEAPTDG